MEYVEILRSRKILIRWSVIIAVGLALGAIGVAGHNVRLSGHIPVVPMTALISLVAFGAFILASVVSPGLNNEAATIAITWTRPMPRTTTAWRFVAVDLLTILAGGIILALAATAQLAITGLLPYVRLDSQTTATLIEAFGCTLMWYALCLVAASRIPDRAGMIAGLSWGAFIVLIIMIALPLPPVLHALVILVNYLNPLAYFSHDNTVKVLGGYPMLTAFIPWLIAIAALVTAIRLWSTREA
jgi:hypothetical protein